MNTSNELPKSRMDDYSHSVAKAALSIIPGVGAFASEFLGFIVTPPLQKRMDEWLQSLYLDVKSLEEKYELFSIDNLQKNEQFITTVAVATHIALRTHHAEKLKALRNAVLNSVIQQDINYQHSIFLNIIDAFNPLHIQYIKHFYEDGNAHISTPDDDQLKYSTLYDVKIIINSQINEKDISVVIMNDLLNRGLIDKTRIRREPKKIREYAGVNMDFSNKFDLIITNFGKAFYHYITR